MPERVRIRVRPGVDSDESRLKLPGKQHTLDEHAGAAHLQVHVDAQLAPLASEFLGQRHLDVVVAHGEQKAQRLAISGEHIILKHPAGVSQQCRSPHRVEVVLIGGANVRPQVAYNRAV